MDENRDNPIVIMEKSQLKNLFIVCLLIATAGLAWFVFDNNQEANSTDVSNTEITQMDLVVYHQDVEAAITSDCGITIATTIQVPQTKAVADASLKYLFTDELDQYGEYESVVIKDGVAQITVTNEDDPTGLKLSSLSSCESRHLFSVLGDTLMQYNTITSIELHSPVGKVEF